MKKVFLMLAAVLVSALFVACSKHKKDSDKVTFSLSLVGTPTSSSFTVNINNLQNVDEVKYILMYEGISDFSEVLTAEMIFNQGTKIENFRDPIVFDGLPSNLKFKLWIAGRSAKGSFATFILTQTTP